MGWMFLVLCRQGERVEGRERFLIGVDIGYLMSNMES